MFTDLRRHLNKKIKQLGIQDQVEAALVCEAWGKAVVSVFGKEGSKNTKALFFKNNILTIQVKNSSWASELKMRQNKLLEEINKKLDKEIVKGIKFRAE